MPRLPRRGAQAAAWTFLTNHGHVLLCLAREQQVRLRDVAAEVGITERMVQRIVADLEGAGYLKRRKNGRQNQYEIDPDRPLRHAVESHQAVRTLIALVARPTARGGSRHKRARPGRSPEVA